LWIGHTLAILKAAGKTPLLMLALQTSACLEDITGRASFSTRTLMPSRPVALFEGILLRSASTISLVIGGMQNSCCDEGGIWLLTKSCERISS